MDGLWHRAGELCPGAALAAGFPSPWAELGARELLASVGIGCPMLCSEPLPAARGASSPWICLIQRIPVPGNRDLIQGTAQDRKHTELVLLESPAAILASCQ